MVQFCSKIQEDRSLYNKYARLFNRIVDWYKKQYQQVKPKLEAQAWSALNDAFDDKNDESGLDSLLSDTLNESIDIKMSIFCVADVLCKLMLSTFSFGPDLSDDRFNFKKIREGISWLDYNGGSVDVTEILQEYLNDSPKDQSFDLAVLSEERSVRNGIVHSGDEALCLSAIRCYNNIRGMISFLDPDVTSNLQEFSYPKDLAIDFQKAVSFGAFEFGQRTKILVVGSMHDIHREGITNIAAMPWNIVIDFDTGRKKGAVREKVKRCIVEQ